MSTSIGKRVYEALNKQITDEFILAYTYLSMSGVLSDMGLDGCAKWTRAQFDEKIARGMKVYEHIISRSAKIKLLAINAPKQDWRAPLHIFEEMMRLEQRMTTAIAAMMDAALADKDHASYSFLKGFIDEQVKKEFIVRSLLDKLKKMQSTELGVIMFDNEIAMSALVKK